MNKENNFPDRQANLLPQMREKTVAIVVCYGDRHHLIKQVASRLKEMGVDCLLVTNEVSSQVKKVVESLVHGNRRFQQLDFEGNIGSAGAYARSLEYAMVHFPDARFFWLLDDDNLPNVDCLDKLLAAFHKLQPAETICGPVVVAVRSIVGPFVHRLMHGVSWKKLTNRRSSFCGFHILHLPRYIRAMFTGKLGTLPEDLIPLAPRDVAIPVEYTYYGSMLIPKEVVEVIGYPNEQLFLYSDDTEYTFRISAKCSIFMIGNAIVEDLDTSWQKGMDGSQYKRMLTAQDPMRVYYHVRNRVWIERYVRNRSLVVYLFHKLCVLSILRLLCTTGVGTKQRLRLIFRAISDGENQRLGQSSVWEQYVD